MEQTAPQCSRVRTLPVHTRLHYPRNRGVVRAGDFEIDQLISNFDAVREFSDESGSSIKLDLSTKQGEALSKLVADYTRQLAEANSIDLDEFQGQAQDSGNGAVVDLRRYLAVQKKIFTEAA